MADFEDIINVEYINPVVNNDIVTQIVFALIILLIGFAAGKLISIALFKILTGIEFDKSLKKISNNKIQISKTISTATSWTIYIITVIIALASLNILKITIIIIAYFILFLLISTIMLGAIFSIPNLLAGIKLKQQHLKEQKINTPLLKGTLMKIGLLNTKIKGEKEEEFLVPNKTLQKNIKQKKSR